MQTDTPSPSFDGISTKLIACGVIVVCVLLGLAGLILPLIPGLLFIAIAAIVAAKLSPKFGPNSQPDSCVSIRCTSLSPAKAVGSVRLGRRQSSYPS